MRFFSGRYEKGTEEGFFRPERVSSMRRYAPVTAARLIGRLAARLNARLAGYRPTYAYASR